MMEVVSRDYKVVEATCMAKRKDIFTKQSDNSRRSDETFDFLLDFGPALHNRKRRT